MVDARPILRSRREWIPEIKWAASLALVPRHGVDSFPPPAKFHKYLGPIMMVTFACLSNTLLLTGALAFGLLSKSKLMPVYIVLVSVSIGIHFPFGFLFLSPAFYP